MKRLLTAALLLTAAACGSSSDGGIADRMKRPLYVGVDRTDRKLTYILDAGRAGVFAWDGDLENYNTARAPGPENPKGFIAMPVGTYSELRSLDVLYTGFAVAETGSALAALYSYGFDDRVGHLTIVPLRPFPVEPTTNVNYTLPAGTLGPFATPEGRFLVVSPEAPGKAVWRVFPEPVSRYDGPVIERAVWDRRGKLLYAADRVSEAVRVFTWPALSPVTTLSLPGRPMDLALHPVDGRLAVLTNTQLRLYGPPPTYALEKAIGQPSLPLRVAFDRHENGAVIAVLNQNTALYFYETDTLCGIDTDAAGFAAVNVGFLDVGDFSSPALGEVSAVGCASGVADQIWQLTYEGEVAGGKAAVTAPTGLGGSFDPSRIQVGDPAFVNGLATAVTAVTEASLFFAPVTQPLALGAAVTYSVRAAEAWTVEGSAAGFLGRVATGEPFRNVIAFTIDAGGAPPTRGDVIAFETDQGVTPIFLRGAPTDMAEDPYGRFVAALPQKGLARAVNVKKDEGAWVIQTLYLIP